MSAYDIRDPKHPGHHSTFADVWDKRDKALSYTEDGRLEDDREREFSVVVVNDLSGEAEEIRLRANGRADALRKVAERIAAHETIDTIQ